MAHHLSTTQKLQSLDYIRVALFLQFTVMFPNSVMTRSFPAQKKRHNVIQIFRHHLNQLARASHHSLNHIEPLPKETQRTLKNGNFFQSPFFYFSHKKSKIPNSLSCRIGLTSCSSRSKPASIGASCMISVLPKLDFPCLEDSSSLWLFLL